MLGLCLLGACNDDPEVSEYQRVKEEFEHQMGGQIDPSQYWKTAVKLRVRVTTTQPTDIVAYCGTQQNLVYDRKEVGKNGTVLMTVPQGYGAQVLLVGNNGKRRVLKNVALTGVQVQDVELVMPDSDLQYELPSAALRAEIPASLNGTDITPNHGYAVLNPRVMLPAIEEIDEGKNAATSGAEINYELISNGPFDVTMFYGFTGCYQSRILGYYYHSPGTYADMKFVDLVETHLYDYIDGKSKVQYQLDGNTDKWYDTNYDYRDGFEPPWTSVTARLGDDIYNLEWVIRKYGKDRITGLRGLAYTIDVPKDYRIGFYLKSEGRMNETQRASIVSKGIPAGVLPVPFYETNFSAMALNKDGLHRSFLLKTKEYSIMGMEDAPASIDYDCNDVIFGLEAGVESELPTITVPDIDFINRDDLVLLPWTIAFEDVARKADFDFNEVVIRVVPDYTEERACVTLLAAGSDSNTKMYLHYNGPDGDENLGEVHALLGGGDYINTTSAVALESGVELDCVAWPKSYTMGTDANRFYVEVVRGSCEDCSDLLAFSDDPGVLPQAICVAGEWEWPKEGVHISTAYSHFPRWAKDIAQQKYWGWHTSPQEDTTVSYTESGLE